MVEKNLQDLSFEIERYTSVMTGYNSVTPILVLSLLD